MDKASLVPYKVLLHKQKLMTPFKAIHEYDSIPNHERNDLSGVEAEAATVVDLGRADSESRFDNANEESADLVRSRKIAAGITSGVLGW